MSDIIVDFIVEIDHFDGGDSLSAFGGDVVEVWCFAADECAEAYNGVVFGFGSEFLGGHGDFEAARDFEDVDILFIAAVAFDGIERTFDEFIGDEAVETRDDDGEFMGRIDEVTFVNHGR